MTKAARGRHEAAASLILKLTRVARPLLLIVCLTAGCGGRGTGGISAGAVKPAPTDAEQIRSAIERWRRANNDGAFATTLDIWAPDLVGWFPGSRDYTYARAEEGAKQRLARGSGAPADTAVVNILEIIIDRDMAVVRDIWNYLPRDASTGRPTRPAILSFEIWQKPRDGKWRIIRYLSAPESVAVERHR
jgi:ketosteroid isomerase-like protein